MSALVVIAKAPLPGRAKTRLSPPCTPEQAAGLAAAALADTFAAVAATPVRRRIVFFDGDAEPWIPAGFDVIAQRGDGLGERLAAAFADVAEPALVIAMDTPQVTPALLRAGLGALRAGAGAVLGATSDGGYWTIGLQGPADVFAGVPMSAADTGRRQHERLVEAGLAPVLLPPLRDIDSIGDARAVAHKHPALRFAKYLRAIERRELAA